MLQLVPVHLKANGRAWETLVAHRSTENLQLKVRRWLLGQIEEKCRRLSLAPHTPIFRFPPAFDAMVRPPILAQTDFGIDFATVIVRVDTECSFGLTDEPASGVATYSIDVPVPNGAPQTHHCRSVPDLVDSLFREIANVPGCETAGPRPAQRGDEQPFPWLVAIADRAAGRLRRVSHRLWRRLRRSRGIRLTEP